MPLLPSASRRLALVVALALSVGAVPPAVPQPNDDALARVEAGLREANPDGVLSDAAGRVEIVLFGQGGMFRRAQATHVLRDFFRRYPPSRVAFAEQASSDDGQTAIWRYWSEDGGAPLTVRVLHRPIEGEAWELVWIRIDQRSTLRAGR